MDGQCSTGRIPSITSLLLLHFFPAYYAICYFTEKFSRRAFIFLGRTYVNTELKDYVMAAGFPGDCFFVAHTFIYCRLQRQQEEFYALLSVIWERLSCSLLV